MTRFELKYVPEPNTGCMLWIAARTHDGYPRFRYRGKTVNAFRWIYERTVGPIPAGCELDHRCRTHECVNVEHAEPVTDAENQKRRWDADGRSDRQRVLRGQKTHNSLKTHCPNGHAYTPENTRRWKNQRTCKACHRMRLRAKRRGA